MFSIFSDSTQGVAAGLLVALGPYVVSGGLVKFERNSPYPRRGIRLAVINVMRWLKPEVFHDPDSIHVGSLPGWFQEAVLVLE